MKFILAALLTTLSATASFAADDAMTHGNAAAEKAAQDKVDARTKGKIAPNKMPEAMKHGNERAEAAAQAKVDAKPKGKVAENPMPEAMKHGNEKAEAAAEAKKAKP